MSVSVLPQKVGLKDEAKNHLSPMVLRGTPEEIDQHFISQVRSPLEKTIGMLTNMAVYEKSMEETIAKSKAATEAKKQEDAKKKAFTEKMKKVEPLFTEKKSADEILLFYSNHYPELTTSSIHSEISEEGKMVFTLQTTIGTKG